MRDNPLLWFALLKVSSPKFYVLVLHVHFSTKPEIQTIKAKKVFSRKCTLDDQAPINKKDDAYPLRYHYSNRPLPIIEHLEISRLPSS